MLESAVVGEIAEAVGLEREAALVGLVAGCGVGVVVGCENEGHMRDNVRGVEEVTGWREMVGPERWDEIVEASGVGGR